MKITNSQKNSTQIINNSCVSFENSSPAYFKRGTKYYGWIKDHVDRIVQILSNGSIAWGNPDKCKRNAYTEKNYNI